MLEFSNSKIKKCEKKTLASAVFEVESCAVLGVGSTVKKKKCAALPTDDLSKS
jgi:hypothetical protein